MSTNLSIVDVTMERITKLLDGMRAEYMIILPGGRTYGTLAAPVPTTTVTRPARKRAPPSLPQGTIQSHIRPFLKDLKPGEVVTIPFLDKTTKHQMQASVTAYCANHWGKGSYVSHVGNNGVELMRTGELPKGEELDALSAKLGSMFPEQAH